MELDIEPLEYVDLKRAIEAVKKDIEVTGATIQMNALVLKHLEEQLGNYPKPELKEVEEKTPRKHLRKAIPTHSTGLGD